MTDLEIRRIPFSFDETVPFGWHPTNPEFALSMNAVSVLAIAFEKYIVAATRQAIPLIDDPAAAAEADAFLRQEATHARAHRLHMRALIAQHPGLQSVLDDAVAAYDRLLATKPLRFHLAYIAALEATFTPTFTMMLDNREQLFAPGDDRVASLFAWHFVEEVEHRSSALVVYDAVVGNPWYRLAVVPRAVVHVFAVVARTFDGFHAHVPPGARMIDGRRLHPLKGPLRKLGARLPVVGARYADHDDFPSAFAGVGRDEVRAMLRGLLRSQAPHHDPQDQPLPAWADTWVAAYAAGEDMTRFEGTAATA